MKHLNFYFDFISPYAYLAFKQLPEALKGISYSVEYRPILFAGLLKHHGQLGPAEIVPKREWTYRHIMWLADKLSVPLRMPASHPFNSLPLLRLALAANSNLNVGVQAGICNRYVCEQLFNYAWISGVNVNDDEHIAALVGRLHGRDWQSDAVKDRLRANTDAAIKQQIFGVPTIAVDGKLFWGLDALPMLRDYLLSEPWFDSSAWQAAAAMPVGASRIKL